MNRLLLIASLALSLLFPSFADSSEVANPYPKRSHAAYRVKTYRSHKPKISFRSHSRKERSRSYTRSRRSSSSHGPTYTSGGTRYTAGERYKSSGLPKVKRSESAKKRFLRAHGYKRVPAGYEVDHIVPLSKGGSDTPSNMQLIPKSTHKQKTAQERKRH